MVIDECRANGVDAESWESGVREEIHFWWGVIEQRLNGANKDQFLSLLDRGKPFAFPELLPGFPGKQIRALDIGSSIYERIGQEAEGYSIEVTAADPLASAYNSLLQIHNIPVSHKIVWGVAEKVRDIFGPESWDLIHASNSLDHGYDPAQALRQIADALKPGGVAVLHHYVNEAENHDYQGFHQWNITSEGDSLVVWNREDRHSVTADMLGIGLEITPGTKTKLSGKRHDTLDVVMRK
jgi:SAM-dependent methyltransferase